MEALKAFVILQLTISSTMAANQWTLGLSSDDFSASINDLQVIYHSQASPCVFVGSGATQFIEHHGNFDIHDTIESRIPLTKISQSGGVITFTAATDTDVMIAIEFVDGDLFGELKISDLPAGYDRIWIRFKAEMNEKVYGGGEQFTHFNMRGKSFPIWTREQGVGRNKSSLITFYADTLSGGAGGDYHTTYYAEPTYFSTRGYMLHSTSTFYTVLDFTNELHHELQVHGNIRILKVAGKSDMTVAQLSQNYVKSNGLMPELPDWISRGAIIGMQGGTKRMNELLGDLEANDVNVTAVWIQDWAGRINTTFGRRVFWNWEWNKAHYPGLDKEIPKLKSKGVRVLTYINPYLNIEGPLFKEADQLGHFVKNNSGQTYIADFGEFYCGTIDLTKPDAVAWYKRRIIKQALDLGISGWMADFSEYLMVDDAVFHSGQSALELHNQWPLLWGKLNREAVEEANKLGEAVFWMRAGYAGLSNYTTLFWAGDQNVDYSESDGLPSTIPAALSVGLQGIGMTHFDIGLYTSLYGMKRDKELFLRSAEMAVFTSAMRTHEGNRPSENWQVYSDVNTMKQFARLVDMYRSLANYTKQMVNNYQQTGKPLQRALMYEYPGDEKTYDIEYQYMFGDDLLVAPVLKPNVTEWTCYLPDGQWVHLWSETEYAGKSTVTVASPIGQPPVFYKNTSSYPWKELKLPLVPPTPPETTTQQNSAGTLHGITLFAILTTLMSLLT